MNPNLFLTAGFFLFNRIIILSAELALYVFIYDNFNLITLPWDYPGTWYFCFIGVDFIYYWFHRAAHGKKIIIYKVFFLIQSPSVILLVIDMYYGNSRIVLATRGL